MAPRAGTHSRVAEQLAEALGTEPCKRVLDPDRAAQTLDVLASVGSNGIQKFHSWILEW